jgi:SpoVK/Ycf46/Vps4 family AAA+-type ATPase
MNLEMMKTADLDDIFGQAKFDFWHYVELRDERIEEEDAKRPLRSDPKEPDDGYVRDIIRLTACVDRASKTIDAVVAERARRADLSNHERLSEVAMRGEVPV